MNQEIVNRNRVGLPATAQYAENSKTKNIRSAIFYAITYMVLTAGIHFAFGIIIIPGAITIQAVIIPAIAFIAMGILFAALLYNRLEFLNKLRVSGGGLQYAMIVFAGVFLATFLTGIYKKNGTDSIITCLFYSCLFLLPYIVYQTWIFYSSITASLQRKVWYLPQQTSHVPVATVFLNSIRINIKIAPTAGAAERVYETTVPGRLSLGIFNNFIYDEENSGNPAIELKDEDNHLYGWTFVTPSFLGLGKRQIDAEVSLNENNIKSKSTIIARRVKINSENHNQLSV